MAAANQGAELARPHRESIIDLTDPTHLLGRFFGDTWPGHLRMTDRAMPGAEIEETDDTFNLDIELPGVAKKDISIDVTGRRVSVHGERAEKQRDGVLRHTTRTTGRFAYELTLPAAVDSDHTTAELSQGVLSIRLPKARSERAAHITVT